MFSKDNRIKIKELLISIRVADNIQLMVVRDDRPDLPHLTITWSNPTPNINVHLTINKKKDQKEYEQIARIPEARLSQLLESFEPELIDFGKALINRAKPVRISWLRRRGYKIFFLSDEDEKQFIQKTVRKQKYGKKKKWTHIPDEQLINDIHNQPELIGFVYHPRKLREIASRRYETPIFAECMYGRRKGQLMVLILHYKLDRKPYWVSLDMESIQKVEDITSDFIRSSLTKLLSGAELKKVYDALLLSEIGW